MERFAQGAFHVAYEQRFDLDALRSKRVGWPTNNEGKQVWMRCWSGRMRIAGI
jgi:hypothetical protein